jgi:hypothetical protein
MAKKIGVFAPVLALVSAYSASPSAPGALFINPHYYNNSRRTCLRPIASLGGTPHLLTLGKPS